MARTVVFDFDGVIHSYTSGWKGETNIPDPPVPGIQEALKEIHDAGYEVVVVSTRCKTVLGRMAIENWLDMYGMTQEVDKVCKEKPPAIAYIDDRAICFDGHPETLLKKIQNFQPWYKKPTLTPPNEWVSVEERLPEPGERVLATDCGFVGEFYINKRGKWQRYNVNCSELLMALDILYWMPLPAPPDRRPPEGDANGK